jgi:cytochrome c553
MSESRSALVAYPFHVHGPNCGKVRERMDEAAERERRRQERDERMRPVLEEMDAADSIEDVDAYKAAMRAAAARAQAISDEYPELKR